MDKFSRNDFLYTPLFCEENIWWLAKALIEKGMDSASMAVLFFTNPSTSILMLNQRATEPGRMTQWDYHVVLQAEIDQQLWIFDFDSGLDFPEPLLSYLQQTFPEQALLPQQFQCRVRVIPASHYLAHFYSDRSHMMNHVAESEFPGYPIIQPELKNNRVELADYLNLHKPIANTDVFEVEIYRDAFLNRAGS